jgi:hypothetical protein
MNSINNADPQLRTFMLNFSQFDRLFAEELVKVPDRFRAGIAQFVLEEKTCPYSSCMRGLYTLGQYLPRGHFGQPVVILYFGSFVKAFPNYGILALRHEIARTITHELLHHWEHRCGIDLLGDEDRQQLKEWKARSGYRAGQAAIGKNYLEAVLFVYLVFVFVAVLARWLGL